jgi:cytochrome c553
MLSAVMDVAAMVMCAATTVATTATTVTAIARIAAATAVMPATAVSTSMMSACVRCGGNTNEQNNNQRQGNQNPYFSKFFCFHLISSPYS